MTTTVVYGDTSDGRLRSGSETYSDARSGVVQEANAGSTQAVAGQDYDGEGWFNVSESFLAFDASAITDTDTISAAVLRLTSDDDLSDTDFTIEARLRDWGTTLTDADWVAGASLSGLTLLAHYATSGGFTAGTGYDFVDDALPGNVSLTGVTRMLLCSSRTTGNNQPSGIEYVIFRAADYTGTTSDPKLTVTHAAGAAAADAPAGNTAATAASYAARIALTAAVGLASITATAHQPTVSTTSSTSAPAGIGTATGTAYGPSAALGPRAGTAGATVAAYNATVATSTSAAPTAGLASVTAAAYQPTVAVSGSTAAQAGLGAVTATGNAPTTAIAPRAGTAGAVVAAYNPTVSTVPATFAPAGLASVTVSANGGTVTITVPAALGTVTATAGDVVQGVIASGGHAPRGIAVNLTPRGIAVNLTPRGTAAHLKPEA